MPLVLKRKTKKTHVLNPHTGRRIKVGGDTHKLVFPHLYKETKKYSNVSKQDFCGAAGGAHPRSYPIYPVQRASNALSRAWKAPNPQGIRNCVLKKAAQRCAANKNSPYCNVGRYSKK